MTKQMIFLMRSHVAKFDISYRFPMSHGPHKPKPVKQVSLFPPYRHFLAPSKHSSLPPLNFRRDFSLNLVSGGHPEPHQASRQHRIIPGKSGHLSVPNTPCIRSGTGKEKTFPKSGHKSDRGFPSLFQRLSSISII